MRPETLEAWLRSRIPEIPATFLPHLLECGEVDREWEDGSAVMELSFLGAEALSRALEKPGRDREAAFQLLAADAFITYACEAAVQGGDIRVGLEGLLAQMGSRFS